MLYEKKLKLTYPNFGQKIIHTFIIYIFTICLETVLRIFYIPGILKDPRNTMETKDRKSLCTREASF